MEGRSPRRIAPCRRRARACARRGEGAGILEPNAERFGVLCGRQPIGQQRLTRRPGGRIVNLVPKSALDKHHGRFGPVCGAVVQPVAGDRLYQPIHRRPLAGRRDQGMTPNRRLPLSDAPLPRLGLPCPARPRIWRLAWLTAFRTTPPGALPHPRHRSHSSWCGHRLGGGHCAASALAPTLCLSRDLRRCADLAGGSTFEGNAGERTETGCRAPVLGNQAVSGGIQTFISPRKRSSGLAPPAQIRWE